MKLNAASDLFKRLIAETNNKSEIKVYENFIAILTDLKHRKLSEEQLKSMEEKLDFLNLQASPENKKRFYSRKLTEYKKYLKEKLSLISEGYYTGIGLALGVSLGVAYGSMFNMGTGIAIGIAIGLSIGASMDAKAKKQNRVLKTK
jgi:hypothetical protein